MTGSPRFTTDSPDVTTMRNAAGVGRCHGSATRRMRSPLPGTSAAVVATASTAPAAPATNHRTGFTGSLPPHQIDGLRGGAAVSSIRAARAASELSRWGGGDDGPQPFAEFRDPLFQCARDTPRAVSPARPRRISTQRHARNLPVAVSQTERNSPRTHAGGGNAASRSRTALHAAASGTCDDELRRPDAQTRVSEGAAPARPIAARLRAGVRRT